MASAIALKPCILTPVPRATSARAFDRGLLLFSREQTSRRTVVTTRLGGVRKPVSVTGRRVQGGEARRENLPELYGHTRRSALSVTM